MKFADRVLETSTTQGTGTYNLIGPTTGFQGFLDGVATGSKIPYVADDGTDWEVGIGTVTAGTPDTLARTTIFASSNAGAAVDWGPGTRNLRLGPTAKTVRQRDENLNNVDDFGTAGGTGNAHTLTLDPVPLAYSNGMIIAYYAPDANTTAVTVNVGGLGAKSLKYGGKDFVSGGVPSGALIVGRYGTANGWFECLNDPTQISAAQVSVASATPNLAAAGSTNILITGTDAITSFGTSGTTGRIYFVRFAGALTFTHHGTSLIIPGGVNITTAAGDCAIVEDLGSNNWRVRSYHKASGLPAVDNSKKVLLLSASPANVASVDFSGFVNDSLYSHYILEGWNLRPQTDGADLWLRTDSDAGASFDAGASDYAYVTNRYLSGTAGLFQNRSAGDTKIILTTSTGDAAAEKADFELLIFNPSNTTFNKLLLWRIAHTYSSGEVGYTDGSGSRLSTADIDSFQLLYSTGQVEAGELRLYGVKKS